MVVQEEKRMEQVPQLICDSAEPEPILTIVETPATSALDLGVKGHSIEGSVEITPKNIGATETAVCAPCSSSSTSSSATTVPVSTTSESAPSRPKKPRGLELPSAPTLPPGLSLDKVNAAVNSLLAPGSGTNTLTPTVITSHALTPVLLTPSPLPSTIHFWSTLSPIAPRSPAKLSFQFPTNGSNQIHIPALSVDGLSTPVPRPLLCSIRDLIGLLPRGLLSYWLLRKPERGQAGGVQKEMLRIKRRKRTVPNFQRPGPGDSQSLPATDACFKVTRTSQFRRTAGAPKRGEKTRAARVLHSPSEVHTSGFSVSSLLPKCMMGSEVLLMLLSLVMSSVCSPVDMASSGGAVLCPLQCVCETRPWYTPQSVFHQANTVDCNELHLQRVPANVSTDTQVLLLQSNNISSISFELQSLTNLTELDLSQNHIKQVSSLELSSQTRLVTLYLEENRIEVLPDFCLRNLSSLEELYINHNQIRTIETWAFSGLTSLLRLHLNSNRLESIDSRWFDSLPALEILMLGENPVMVLKEGSFQSLPRLHSLVLASMGLQSVSPKAFAGLDCLESLSFYDNKLRSVPRDALKVLPNLKFLDLNRNPISRIKQGDFQDLLHLQEISVNNMELLQMVEPKSFQNLPELIKVEMCNNIHLSHLHPHTFSDVPWLRSLMVHSSSLSFLSPLLLSSLPSLKELSVHSNPLRCDCLQTWAAHLGNSSHLTLLEPTLTVCHAPLHLIGQQLQRCCLPQISSNVFPSVMNVSEGQPITIECWADADPAPQFYWVTPTGDKVSSEAIAAPIMSQKEPEGRGLSTMQRKHRVQEPGALVIDHAEASDTGTYTCVAWNAEGADTKSLSVFVELQNPERTTSSESSLEQSWLGSNSSNSLASLVVLAKVVHSQSVVLEWKLHPTKNKQDQNQEQDPPGTLPQFTAATVHIHNPHISYTAKVPADVQEYNLTHLLPSTLYHICLTISSAPSHSLSHAPSHTSCLNVTTKDSAFSVELVTSRHGGVAVAAILGSMFALCIMALLLFYMGRRRVVNLPQSHAHSLKKYMQHTTSIPLNELYPPLIMLWESEAEKDKEEKEEEHREEGHIDTSKTTYMW
ncbi:hypothetical protein WMY93_027691 [Mugilogobius chulae]|uniref:Ig-like domain-containing protein n=1 Tax=Mugilogobius chulae TaxID=88201 RepID=A0AAW0N3W1_9GOBI